MKYNELKSCINAAKTEEELLEARKAFRQFREMGGDAREVSALYQRIKNKATKLVTPKALKARRPCSTDPYSKANMLVIFGR